MANTHSTVGRSHSPEAKGYEPKLPITISTVLDWPPRPLATLRHLFTGVLLPHGLLWIGLAVLVWNFFTPAMDRMTELRPRWMLEIYLRNVVMVTVMAGGLHLALYIRRTQQQRYKYHERWLSTTNRSFLWTSQVRDNMFWGLVSGCAIWSIYESLTLWAYANGYVVGQVQWGSLWDSAYLAALTVAAFWWAIVHFYLNHRLLHTKWLYDHAHYLHHRNVNTGPWSGISMHPLEHVVYFSLFLVWWVLPAHPVLVVLFAVLNGVTPAVSHSGFDRVELVSRRAAVPAANYFHCLHHRYFECNYGYPEVPVDKLFGTFHDGTPEAHARMRQRMKARRGSQAGTGV